MTLGGGFAQAVALEGEPVGIVHEAIEDSVGNGGVTDDLVPMLDRELACHDGRAAAVAVFHDLQQVASLIGSCRGKSPVVEDQKLNARQALEESSVPAVTAREGEHIEQPRQPLIEYGAVIPAGLMAQRASDPALADAGRADDEQVLMPIDPIAGNELVEQRLVEPARGCLRYSVRKSRAKWSAGMLVGYARVSTDGQSLTAQVAELKAAGCAEVSQEKVSGAKTERAQLSRLVNKLEAGDVLVVTRLDRLARSTRDLATSWVRSQIRAPVFALCGTPGLTPRRRTVG